MPRFRLADDQPRRRHRQTVQVVDDLLDRGLLERAYEGLKTRYLPPVGFLWIDLAEVTGHARGDRAPLASLAAYVGEDVARFLLEFLRLLYFEVIPDLEREEVAGFEVGSQVVSTPEIGDRPVNIHFDCDARLLPQGIVRGPTWSTILHVGPDAPLVGGESTIGTAWPIPEAIFDRVFTPTRLDDLHAITDEWLTVGFKANRLIAFHGVLPHFRRPVRKLPDPSLPRVAVVAAVYDRKVLNAEGCCPFPPEVVRILHGLRMREQVVIADVAAQLTPEEFVALAEGFGPVYGRDPDRPIEERRVVIPKPAPKAATDPEGGEASNRSR